MKISQHMTTPAVTITTTTSIPQARQLLQERHFRHLPVVDQAGLLQGMVTDRDLRSAYPSSLFDAAENQLRQEQLEQTPVAEIMSPATFTLAAAATLDDALLLLDREGVGALPVVDDEGRVAGIFSIRDLIGAYRNLFGLGEWGSAMLALHDDGQPRPLSRLCAALEQDDIHFHRLLRATGPNGEKIIYLRVNTCNLPAVRKSLAAAGFSAYHD